MIISASRRTDIPAFYGEWFIKRLREKKVFVRNPMNAGQVTELALDPQNIDCIVFWTKNPKNFLQYLDEIDSLGYRYYFQFTLTPYNAALERNVGDKAEIIETFIELSQRIGKERVIWRYDPIIFSETYSLAYHERAFASLCTKLRCYTEKCVISFIDRYGFLEKDFTALKIHELSAAECGLVAKSICKIAEKYTIRVCSCCEKIDLDEYRIARNKCIDDELVNRICGSKLKYRKDAGQRERCRCTASRDIGAYNTCRHNCVYCYAKRGPEKAGYNPDSSELYGPLP
ncbi:MAG: DUF1848 domain-containing protein [Treponema sp.]|jgi:hypothetical protein|nr:DUF1848 domain-containing protein [Treponema sp.]